VIAALLTVISIAFAAVVVRPQPEEELGETPRPLLEQPAEGGA
jgi:hypothetical protein